jgi:hypothetical protein
MSYLDHDLGKTKGYMVWCSEFKMGSLHRSLPRRLDIGLSSRWGHYAAVCPGDMI